MHITPLGDAALLIEVGTTIDEHTLEQVRATCDAIERAQVAGVTDIVPGYASVAVHYDPLRATASVRRAVEQLLAAGVAGARAADARTIEIPVRYGGEDGPDLEEVAAAHAMSVDDVVALHTGPTYLVHMIGFVPGFPYLGGLERRLATPRRGTPRTRVPAGSVGIGGPQTGVYPIESPGGWNLIGRTELRLFDVDREAPALLRVGDRVRFVAVGTAGSDPGLTRV